MYRFYNVLGLVYIIFMQSVMKNVNRAPYPKQC